MAVEIPPLIKPSRLRRRGGLLGECMAEFLGTFVLISFGCGVVATAVAALPGSGRAATPTTIFLAAGDWLLITFGWAFAVCFGVYVAGGVSGAHLNPAVTLAMAIRRGFAWTKVLPFMLSQVVGAFAGAALVYLVYHNAISAYDQAATGPKVNGRTNATFSIFATFPAAYFHGGVWGPLIDQIVGTAFLLMLIAALIDLRNQAVKANLGPLLVGFVVAAIGMSYGANAGYAINPARDFGPRLLTYAAGWQSYAFPGSVSGVYSGYWWIPIVGPLVGGTIGILIYDLFIGDVLLVRAELGELPEPGRARGVKEVDEE
ncbi:MIP/aquaporin family protein [Streptomyces diastatochromogenes]|uniref:Aquaporin n=1 Tax=Streptomyces diastatochromogenes TaxID=42236 RepID=A0A233SPY8_STRDA|nr:MIP family channel protein [Streptomyces diastatochromogenes]MCZ0988006.1 MIP family channel protein [Streptomyces diastatochromogenes]OXY97720.1 aquaporin [Streptomyces diastatochromogenes]